MQMDKSDSNEKSTANKFNLNDYDLQVLETVKSIFNFECLIGGTGNGDIKVFPKFTTSFMESYEVHLGAVTCVCNSSDGRFLFTAGEDGALFIFSITQEVGGKVKELLPDIGKIDNGNQEGEKEINPRIACVDDDLADIVLVEKNIFLEFA